MAIVYFGYRTNVPACSDAFKTLSLDSSDYYRRVCRVVSQQHLTINLGQRKMYHINNYFSCSVQRRFSTHYISKPVWKKALNFL